MSHQINLQDGTGIIANIPGYGTAILCGTGAPPADGKTGYAPGCLYLRLTGNGIGTTLYCNEGSKTSCDFNAK